MKLKVMTCALLLANGLLLESSARADEQKKLLVGFVNESRAGVVVTTGNSKTQTFDLSQKDTYEWRANKLGFLGTYLRSSSKGLESARRWSLGLRYDRILADRWSLFLAETLEGDFYAGYFQRYNTDVGGKYSIIKEEANNWSLEAGYRYQRENQITGNQKNSSFARLYSEYEHRWNPSVSSKLWAEVMQNLSIGDDRFINSEVSVKAALTSIFSVQLAYLLRYRNLLPASVVYKTDTTLTAALLAQF